MLSVYIDTLVICSATAFMLLASGVAPDKALAGMPYVQAALSSSFGSFGIYFVTVALFLFAFTTLLGNYYYAEQNLKYLAHGHPGAFRLNVFRLSACLLVFIGTQLEFGVVWDTADVLMGLMALINIPVIFLLRKPALACLAHYRAEKREGKNPVFKQMHIRLHLPHKLDFWN
jgi:AGCS family alanine or glycine:cation symporter